jgi:Gpi18-like mannosyltransferase
MRAADLATIVLVCAVVWVHLSGGMRTSVAGIRVSLTSPARLALLALAITVVRHAIRRRPSLLDAVRLERFPRLPAAWSNTASIWAISRLSVILAGYFAVLIIGFPRPQTITFSEHAFVNLPARWDATWYLDVAVRGYRWDGVRSRHQNVAFFPAFPLTMRVGGALLGAYAPGIGQIVSQRRMLLAGWLVALGAFWLALVYVYRWSEARAGPSAAKAAVTLLAAYPFAVFFSAPYTESLYLLATAATFVHFERAEWFRSAGWGFLVGLVRPNGVFVTIPLALIAALSHGSRRHPGSGIGMWVALAAPCVALFFHALYLQQLTGSWFAWSEVQAAWGRTYEVSSWLGMTLAEIADRGAVQYVEATPVTILNALAAALAVVLLWPVTKTAGLPYAVFVLVNLVPPLASGGFISIGRFTSTLFPLFFALAVSIRERHVAGWLVGFSVLQGLLAALFFTWRQPV